MTELERWMKLYELINKMIFGTNLLHNHLSFRNYTLNEMKLNINVLCYFMLHLVV